MPDHLDRMFARLDQDCANKRLGLPLQWTQEDGCWFYDGNCISTHKAPPFRVGYLHRLALFDTLQDAKEFVEQLTRPSNVRSETLRRQ